MGISSMIKGAASSLVSNKLSSVTGSSSGASAPNVSGANYRAMDSFTDTNLVDTRLLAKFEALSWIHGLPPMVNNIVDPPPIMSDAQLNQKMTPFSEFIGRDYVETVLQKGQFLVLVPLDLIPSIPAELATNLGAKLDRAWEVLNLDKFQDRLDISAYGFRTEISSVKYNRACKALMLTILLSLGLDTRRPVMARRFLPKYLVDVLYNNSTTGRGMDYFPQLDFGTEPGPETTNKNGGDLKANQTVYGQFVDKLQESESQPTASESEGLWNFGKLFGAGDGDQYTYGKEAGAGEGSLLHQDALNVLKYITNADDDDQLNKKLPWSVFYCNGGIEPQFGMNQDLQDSALAKSVVDIGAQLLKKTGAGEALAGAEEFISELAYHHQGVMGNMAGYLVENTSIPKIIRGNMLDMQYSITIKQTALGSDPYSLVRPLSMLAFLMPFVVSPNSANSRNVVPESPLYCAAFSKGAINIPRGAITSLMVKTDPVFRTTAGVPMDIEVTLTLQPLMAVGTMPNWGTIFKNQPTKSELLSAMYNPMGAIPILATMAGSNVILTKFPLGFFDLLISGTVGKFWANLKGVKSWIGDTIYDWNASDTARFGRIAASVLGK